jgi:DNA-binding NarL/FixJ family response regulator
VAAAAQARGAVALAAGDARAAAPPLREATRLWLALGAPYDAARARLLVADACRSLGDPETARLELAAAREELTRLGAAAGRDRLREGLTPRELEVLLGLASGQRNKEIAARLGVSRRTVDRHVSNLYAKLRVSSRAAATAWAYEHDLV